MILSTSSNSCSRRAALKTFSTRLILPLVSLAKSQEAQPHSPASTGIMKAPTVRPNITVESDQPKGGFTPNGASRQTIQAKDMRMQVASDHPELVSALILGDNMIVARRLHNPMYTALFSGLRDLARRGGAVEQVADGIG